MDIPSTARGIINSLINDYHYTIKEIAKEIAVTPKTIYQILNQDCIAAETDKGLIIFYVQVRILKLISLSQIGRERTEAN